jgi:cysteine desulfurase
LRRIFVDYAATTPVDPRVVEAMKPYFTKKYGNASSINSFGLEPKKALEDARQTLADMMNTTPTRVIFTGSATEANNLALKGLAFKEGKDNFHLATSKIEHDSVLNTAKWLKRNGFKVTFIPVDRYGLLDLLRLENALKKGVSLVSVIHVNNEIGTIQPIKEIGKLCHKYGAYFHTDAAQSFGKIPIDVKEMNVDLMTSNAHKIYGPKGVGSLFIKKGLKIEPLLHGGGQESDLRSSTENIPGIIGFAKALGLRKREMEPETRKLKKLSNQLIKATLEIQDTYLNGHLIKKIPNITNFRFSFIEGESLLLLLNEEGIAASTGSACSSRSSKPSHVLIALGLKPEELHGNLRISIGKYNTQEDIDYILEVLPKCIEQLRKISPLSKS